MTITIVGFSSPKVDQTLVNALAASSEFEELPDVRWINDTHGIAELGRTTSPTVLINGTVRTMGRIPSVYEFTCWIREELADSVLA